MAEDKPIFLTAEGRAKLEEELWELIEVRRPEIADKIHQAKMDGDVSENAGYEAAKHEQAFVEGRILTLENMLKKAVLIRQEGPTDRVRLGARVTIVEDGGVDEEIYQIVGSAEVDASNGYISNESPLGRSLIGRAVGDSVSVEAPGGSLRFKIVSID